MWPLPEMLCAPLFSTRARAGFRARSAHTRLLSADERDERMVKYLSSDRKTLTWSCGSFNATGTRLWLDPLIPPMVDRSWKTLGRRELVSAWWWRDPEQSSC